MAAVDMHGGGGLHGGGGGWHGGGGGWHGGGWHGGGGWPWRRLAGGGSYGYGYRIPLLTASAITSGYPAYAYGYPTLRIRLPVLRIPLPGYGIRLPYQGLSLQGYAYPVTATAILTLRWLSIALTRQRGRRRRYCRSGGRRSDRQRRLSHDAGRWRSGWRRCRRGPWRSGGHRSLLSANDQIPALRNRWPAFTLFSRIAVEAPLIWARGGARCARETDFVQGPEAHPLWRARSLAADRRRQGRQRDQPCELGRLGGRGRHRHGQRGQRRQL